MKKLMLFTLVGSLIGCGSVGNAVISDSTLQDKAAFALNTTADNVKISQRRGGLDDVRFVATIGNKSYQCYITTIAGVISSDALCSGAKSTKATHSQCNELLKKAGRC